MDSKSKLDKDALLVEYSAANDVFIHFDNYSWMVGSVLIAGVFIFWGFLLSIQTNPKESTSFVIITSSLVNIILSLWMLYADHNRQIVLSKLHRIHQIEKKFGMKQHIGWVSKYGERNIYKTLGLKGHTINLLIFIVTSVGTILLGVLIQGKISIYWLIPLSISLLTVMWVSVNESKIKKYLRSIDDQS